jgi:hypothetical protein
MRNRDIMKTCKESPSTNPSSRELETWFRIIYCYIYITLICTDITFRFDIYLIIKLTLAKQSTNLISDTEWKIITVKQWVHVLHEFPNLYFSKVCSNEWLSLVLRWVYWGGWQGWLSIATGQNYRLRETFWERDVGTVCGASPTEDSLFYWRVLSLLTDSGLKTFI